MKRFYDRAEFEAVDDGVAVTLDGKIVKTPARRPLVLPNDLIAGAIAREWSAQGETIEPDSMPLMQIGRASCRERV